MSKPIITTSWDDGHILDLKLADLLRRYRIPGTFYISPKNREIKPATRLTPSHIRQLAESFEIGAHTMTHPRLNTINISAANEEIRTSKQYLEDITAHPITSFCYPGGAYTPAIKQAVRSNGFTYARTVERFFTSTIRSAFDAPTSLHAYRHWSDLMAIARFAHYNLLKTITYVLQWDKLAIAQLEALRHAPSSPTTQSAQTKSTTPVFHLWGHSWEIEKNKDWRRLENVLAYIDANRKVFSLKTNAEVAKYYSAKPRLLLGSSHSMEHIGGLEGYVKAIASGLADKNGWDVQAVSCGAPSEVPCLNPKKTTKQLRITSYVLRPTFTISNTPFGFGWRRQLSRLLEEIRPDVVNVHMPVPGLSDMLVKAASREGIPSVVTYHSSSMKKGNALLDPFIGMYERYILPRCLNRAQRIIASSSYVKETFLSGYHAKTVVITPGVDTSYFKPARKPRKKSAKGQVVTNATKTKTEGSTLANGRRALYVGAYTRSASFKRLSDFLSAAAMISPQPHVDVVGYSDIQPTYAELASSVGLESVTFHGALQGKALLEAYRTADVLVLPSVIESYPMVLVEALACGVPVVAYNTGGIGEIIENGRTGALIPQKDVYGLGHAMLELFNKPKTYQQYRTASRAWALKHAAWHHKFSAYHDTLVGVLREAGGA